MTGSRFKDFRRKQNRQVDSAAPVAALQKRVFTDISQPGGQGGVFFQNGRGIDNAPAFAVGKQLAMSLSKLLKRSADSGVVILPCGVIRYSTANNFRRFALIFDFKI